MSEPKDYNRTRDFANSGGGVVHHSDGTTSSIGSEYGMNAGSAVNSDGRVYTRNMTGDWNYNPVASPLTAPKVELLKFSDSISNPYSGNSGSSPRASGLPFSWKIYLFAIVLIWQVIQAVIDWFKRSPGVATTCCVALAAFIFALIRFGAFRVVCLFTAIGYVCGFLLNCLFGSFISSHLTQAEYYNGVGIVSLALSIAYVVKELRATPAHAAAKAHAPADCVPARQGQPKLPG